MKSIDNSMIIRGDARHLDIPDGVVQCVVTSPPYWGLRKYAGEQELVWGGEPAHCWEPQPCEHEWGRQMMSTANDSNRGSMEWTTGGNPAAKVLGEKVSQGSICIFCGAWHGAFGLEPTIEMYVQHSVEILREIRRVLRPDGVCFWNIGDSYASGGAGGYSDKSTLAGFTNPHTKGRQMNDEAMPRKPGPGLKPKDLCLIPARVALAAQADGWWVRSDIIWSKPNPMPESVKDRPTDAYEHILMLTKSARYYWDAEAVKEPIEHPKILYKSSRKSEAQEAAFMNNAPTNLGGCGTNPTGRNLRNVWTFPTQPYKGAHFATFPERLVELCVKAASKPGDIILDPFAGSGTTGLVALRLDRLCILVDLAYQDLQLQRLQKP